MFSTACSPVASQGTPHLLYRAGGRQFVQGKTTDADPRHRLRRALPGSSPVGLPQQRRLPARRPAGSRPRRWRSLLPIGNSSRGWLRGCIHGETPNGLACRILVGMDTQVSSIKLSDGWPMGCIYEGSGVTELLIDG